MPVKKTPKVSARVGRGSKVAAVRKSKPAIRRAPPRPGAVMSGVPKTGGMSMQNQMLVMQGMLGNRAVSQLIQRAKQAEATANRAEGGPVTDSFMNRLQRSRGGGAALPAQTQQQMGPYFGDLKGVRLHTGREAVQMSEEIGAEAFTQGRDIYMGARDFSPNSSSGKRLLAHELTHVKQQTGGQTGGVQRSVSKGVQIKQVAPAGLISRKKKKLHLDFIRMKRDEPKFGKMIKKFLHLAEHSGGYGHYWTEIGDLDQTSDTWTPQESYGWWPRDGVDTAKETIKGVPGQLNQGEGNDPHHGDEATKEFHPVMEIDDTADYDTVREQVVSDVRNFAYGFAGKWKWRLGWGKNCQTFQKRLKAQLGLHYQKGKGWFSKPADVETFKNSEEAKEATRTDDFEQAYPGIDYELWDDLEAGEYYIPRGFTVPEGTTVRLGAEQTNGNVLDGYQPRDGDLVKIYVRQHGGHVWELRTKYSQLMDSLPPNREDIRADWEKDNPGTDYVVEDRFTAGITPHAGDSSTRSGTRIRLVDEQDFGDFSRGYEPDREDMVKFYTYEEDENEPQLRWAYHDVIMNNCRAFRDGVD